MILSPIGHVTTGLPRPRLFIKCFQQQVMDNVTNPKKETLIRTTVFRTCSRYIQCTYMCTVYIIFYIDPRRRVLRCRCLCFGSSVLVQVNGWLPTLYYFLWGPNLLKLQDGLRGFGLHVWGLARPEQATWALEEGMFLGRSCFCPFKLWLNNCEVEQKNQIHLYISL